MSDYLWVPGDLYAYAGADSSTPFVKLWRHRLISGWAATLWPDASLLEVSDGDAGTRNVATEAGSEKHDAR